MQRIAIIRALNRDYQWIILDEPFSHLDQANTQMAIDLILEESAAKDAGIIITALDHRDSDSRFQKISV
jgi:putative ABC transport system ATP-binding protein